MSTARATEMSSSRWCLSFRTNLRAAHTTTHPMSPTLIPITAHRTPAAAEYDSPTPVNISTYAATHAGHFGTSASTATGPAH